MPARLGALGQTPPGLGTVRAAAWRGPSRVPGTVKPPSRYDYYTNQTYLYQDSAYFAAFIGKQAPSARSVLKALADDLDVCPRTEEK
jgi:hypothetical protein